MKKVLSIVLACGLVFTGYSIIQKENKECINVFVDYPGDAVDATHCVNSDFQANALDVLLKAGYKIEGTIKYGDAVVCRVNGFPDKSVESCESMPPAEAYWAVLVKKKQEVPIPKNEWGWAQKGINETYLTPGDHLGLVFAENGEIKFPA